MKFTFFTTETKQLFEAFKHALLRASDTNTELMSAEFE